jgi:hypothetical protein
MIRPSGTATDDAIVGGARHGGITSIPGAPGVTTESCRSTPPGDLRAMGYDVRDLGDGERIQPPR